MPTTAATPLLALPARAALDVINADEMLAHITALSADSFGGRSPGSPGEQLSVDYIVAEFKQLGLQPGNPDGSYIQDVPLAGITAAPTMQLTVGGNTVALRYPDDFVAATARLVPEITVENSQIVFVGYGVVAPEYGWDDYKDVDVRGKTILMLAGDPAVPDPEDPSRLDETMFKGHKMTYYGRWTYKYEIAAQKGAAAAILIHETGPAGYPYSVVRTSWKREIYEVDAEDKNMGAVPVRSWVTWEVARKLLADDGKDFEALKAAAVRRDFAPVALAATVDFTLTSEVRSFKSRNVLARLDGTELRDEWVVYSAHWDHLGQSPGDGSEPAKIFRGALDNASGVATLLGLAKAFAKLNPRPRRSVLFLAPTAEESGLLGARYYATHPLYPLEKTLADINIDGVNPWGRTTDIENVSEGHSNLDDLLVAAAKAQGRTVVPDTQPEKGMVYRADHFEFFKRGVPSLYPSGGQRGDRAGCGLRPMQKMKEYVAQHYHQPSDRIDPAWDLSGAVEDAQLLFHGRLSWSQTGTHIPQWNPGRGIFPGERGGIKRRWNRCAWASFGTCCVSLSRSVNGGVPQHDDRALFEFVILEGAQAGLSWETILKRRESYRRCF